MQCWSPRGQVLVLEDSFEVLGLGLEACVLDSITEFMWQAAINNMECSTEGKQMLCGNETLYVLHLHEGRHVLSAVLGCFCHLLCCPSVCGLLHWYGGLFSWVVCRMYFMIVLCQQSIAWKRLTDCYWLCVFFARDWLQVISQPTLCLRWLQVYYFLVF